MARPVSNAPGDASTDRWGPLRAAGRSAGVLIPVVFIASFITFLLGSATGQDPASNVLGEVARPEDIERMRGVFGLDRPLLERYFDWLWNALHGDLGVSWFSNIPVTESLFQRLPVTLSVAALALLISVVVGGALGITAALRQGRFADRAITIVSSVFATIPGFVASIGLVLVFAVLIPVFPSGGYVPARVDVGLWLSSITLPAVALSLDTTADIARQLRTGLVDALGENYVIGARMRGLPRWRVVAVHALRNGAGPAVAQVGMHVPRLLGGAVITEAVFALPGLGMLTREAALRGDVPVVQGTLLLSILVVVASSAVINGLLYAMRPTTRRVT